MLYDSSEELKGGAKSNLPFSVRLCPFPISFVDIGTDYSSLSPSNSLDLRRHLENIPITAARFGSREKLPTRRFLIDMVQLLPCHAVMFGRCHRLVNNDSLIRLSGSLTISRWHLQSGLGRCQDVALMSPASCQGCPVSPGKFRLCRLVSPVKLSDRACQATSLAVIMQHDRPRSTRQ